MDFDSGILLETVSLGLLSVLVAGGGREERGVGEEWEEKSHMEREVEYQRQSLTASNFSLDLVIPQDMNILEVWSVDPQRCPRTFRHKIKVIFITTL